MNAQEIIQFIGNAEKKTPVRMFVKEKNPIDYGSARVFGAGDKIVFGDWKELSGIVRDNADSIEDIVIENDCRNSAVHLLDIKDNRYLPHDRLRHVVNDFRNVPLVAEDMHLAHFRFDLVQRQVLCQRLADRIKGRGRYLLDRHINPCHRLFG